MKRKFNSGLLLSILFILFSNFSFAQQQVQQWERFEVILKYAYTGNSFINVKLSATFTSKDTSCIVNGFYDGDNTFKARFMPEKTGTWQYITQSNIKQLNNQKGSFECVVVDCQ